MMHIFVWVCQQALNLNDQHETDLISLFDGYQRTLLKELDFTHEIENAERSADFFKHDNDIYIPTYYKQLSSKRLIIMEFMHGVKVSLI